MFKTLLTMVGLLLSFQIFANGDFIIKNNKSETIYKSEVGLFHKMLLQNLERDNQSCMVSEEQVRKADQLIPKGLLQISGHINYAGIIPGKYKYDVHHTPGEGFLIKVKIYIKNYKEFSGEELMELAMKLKSAEGYWTKQNPYPYKVRFKFRLTDKEDEAHVTPKLVRELIRGPYYSKWSTKWSTAVVTHEIGHVLGLDDEYKQTLFGGDDSICDQSSVMCTNGWKHSYAAKYHYYIILRRLFCN